MLSKYVIPGNRVEIQAVERTKYIDNAETINPKTAKREDNMLTII